MSRRSVFHGFCAASALLAGCLAEPGFRGRRSQWFDERMAPLMERAAFDFSCPKDQLQTRELGQQYTQGVTGCGYRATYLFDYGHDQWLINGAVETSDTARTAPAATSPTTSVSPGSHGSSGGMTTP